MPYRSRRRELFITVNPWMLVGSIAVGLWLGSMAILITCALIYKVYEEQQIFQVNSALRQMGEVFLTPPARPQVDASAQMLEQFKQNQAQLQREQAEAQAQAQAAKASSKRTTHSQPTMPILGAATQHCAYGKVTRKYSKILRINSRKKT